MHTILELCRGVPQHSRERKVSANFITLTGQTGTGLFTFLKTLPGNNKYVLIKGD